MHNVLIVGASRGIARALSGRVSRGGVVAFMSSQMASLALGLSATMPLYGASKAALNSLVRSWEGEFEELPFSLLLLHPGWVRTEMGGVNACRFVDYRNQPLPW